MEKKYVVRLTDEERNGLKAVVKRLKGSSEKVRRAQVLLAADADGPNWTRKSRTHTPAGRRPWKTSASGW